MITILENGKYILHLPDWAENVYLKFEELPYKEGLRVLRIYYRDKKAYCLYHSGLKHHTPWVGSVDELDKKYQYGEINPLRGIVVYDTDMWGDPIPIKIYLEEDDNFRYRCEIDGKLKYIDFLQSIFKRLRRDYPLVNWDFVHYKGKFVNWV
jgi:hypothetical protein